MSNDERGCGLRVAGIKGTEKKSECGMRKKEKAEIGRRESHGAR
jgi:hypothetical protein